MEDALDVYQRPYDERKPVACLDETANQRFDVNLSAKSGRRFRRGRDSRLSMIMSTSAKRWRTYS
jgi:hypothetical protein